MDEFWRERIRVTQEQLIAYEDALTALNGGVTSYTINTGQSQTTVSRASIPDINRTIDSLTNRLVTYNARLTGSGVTRVIPGW